MTLDNSFSQFNISYPQSFGETQNSKIIFFDSKPDLKSLFYETEENQNNQRRFFVTDSNVASLECMSSFVSLFDDGVYQKDFLLILGSGEKYKTTETVLNIITNAVDNGFTRNDIFVGIGGGVICDITSFASSIYKRGANVQFVPTTLLAMVDACIGGKTGCDFENYKNIIGTFFPAEKIFYFPQFIQTLPENQFNSGLAESFKTALLFDKEFFEIFENENEKINKKDSKILNIIIKKCVKLKAEIVEKDFTEKNIRTFLNLGHTFGHALESVVGLGAITHGSAVAWGISRCLELSCKNDLCLESFKNRVFAILKKYGWETSSIPSIVKGGGVGERLVKVMHTDKKNLNQKIRIVLPKQINDVTIKEFDDKDILEVLK